MFIQIGNERWWIIVIVACISNKLRDLIKVPKKCENYA